MKMYKMLLVLGCFLGTCFMAISQPTEQASDNKLSQTSEVLKTDPSIPGKEANQDNILILIILFAVVGVLPLVIMLRFRLFRTKKTNSKLNDILYAEQKKLKSIQAQMSQAYEKEKETRRNLEITHHNLKAAQSQLIHAEKMSSLGQLTAGIAHEINNPVGFIKGGVETLKWAIGDLYQTIEEFNAIDTDDIGSLKERIEEQKVKALEAVNETKDMTDQLFKDVFFGTDRVTEIVNGLRVFSRHDEAKVKEANLHENLDAALRIIKHKIKDKAEIIKQYDSSLSLIECLPGQLNQVFVNLISNAVDAMDKFGTVVISTHDLGNTVQLSFKDNGKGIPDKIKEKIFDPFFTTKDVGEGTGLGLSITHSIIEEHKGKIEVFSERGVGTEFRITLLKYLQLEEEKSKETKIKEDKKGEINQLAEVSN